MPERERIACAVCDSATSTPLIQKFGLTISRCPRCGLVFANPRASVEEIWARYSPTYFWDEYLPAHGVIDGQFDLEVFDRTHAEMLGLIARRAGIVGRMLEVGTGAGFFLKAAERAGWRCAGVEVSREAARFAKEQLALEVTQGSAEEIAYPPGSFDVAVLFEVIEHLLDPARALRAVRQAVRPGGLVLLSTPNYDALSRRLLGRQWAVISPGEHLYYFTEPSLTALLEKAGFARVQFQRKFPGFDLTGTMNHNCTHEPTSRRAAFYKHFVQLCGPALAPAVRAGGLGDTLLCFAVRPVD
jgi:SAM-dependent methyltransferase